MEVSTGSAVPSARVARRVAVVCDLRLVEETVAAALAGTGHHVARVPWPADGETPELSALALDVVVIVCAEGESAVSGIRAVLRESGDARSVVVSGSRPGPLWGGLIEAGAHAVVAGSTSIEQLLEVIETLARGDQVLGFVERQSMLRQWFAARSDQVANEDRLAQLTPRELEVLELLHAGNSTAAIAELLEVSLTTVRSQIRAILRKLGVRSQLAAVAVLEATRVGPPGAP